MTTCDSDSRATFDPLMWTTCTAVDTRALLQALREAIGCRNVADSFMDSAGIEAQLSRAELAGIIRCVAYMLGATYHAGYDKTAASLWSKACEVIRRELAAVPVRDVWASRAVVIGDARELADRLLPLAVLLGE